MKVNVHEYNGCFSVDLEAETLLEATQLARLGMNALREVRSITAQANKDSAIVASIVVGKSKSPAAQIAKGKW